MVTAVIEGQVPAIYEAIAEVRKALPRLAKNGVGPQTQGSYKFLSVDDILEAVRPLENEHGIISYPVGLEYEFHYNKATDKGDGRVPKENVQGLVEYTFRYASTEDGSFIDVPVLGEGIDTQDKATRKATTQAQKIANILIYNIITGEQDPDAQDGGRDAQEDTTPAQRRINNARQAPTTPSTPPANRSTGNPELDDLKKKVRDYIAAQDDSEAARQHVMATQERLKGETKKNGLELQKVLVAELGI